MGTSLLRSIATVALSLLATQGAAVSSEPPIVAFSGTPNFMAPNTDQSIWNNSSTGFAQGGVGQIYTGANGSGVPGAGALTAISTTKFSLEDGAVVLSGQVNGTEFPAVPGTSDVSVMALANEADLNNAIEMATVGPQANPVLECRTVSGGSVTETDVALTENLGYQYEIVAKSDVVKFYLNGVLVATHRKDIPTKPLHMLFAVSSEGSTPVLLNVTQMEFEQFPHDRY